MHLSDGVLSLEVTVATTTVAVGLLLYSFKNLKSQNIALASAMSALFFIASFIHIPFGVTQIHLMLVGFIGIFLGSVAIFSITLALILQALLLGYGGVSSLGANIIIMAFASYCVYLFFQIPFTKALNEKLKFFLVGFLGVMFSSIFMFIFLLFSKDEYLKVAYSILLVNIPTMIIEAIITLFLLIYIKKTMPNLLKDTAL